MLSWLLNFQNDFGFLRKSKQRKENKLANQTFCREHNLSCMYYSNQRSYTRERDQKYDYSIG